MSELILTDAAAFHQARMAERPEVLGRRHDPLKVRRGGSGVQYALARQEQRRWQRYIEQVLSR
jgi:hypothetical protein